MHDLRTKCPSTKLVVSMNTCSKVRLIKNSRLSEVRIIGVDHLISLFDTFLPFIKLS